MRFLLALALFSVTSLPAVAQDIRSVSVDPGQFDPFSGMDGVASLNISVSRGEGEAPVRLIVRPIDSGPLVFRGPERDLAYAFRARDRPVRASGEWSIVLGPASEQRIVVDLVVTAPRYAAAGDYESELEIVLVDETGAELDRRQVLASLQVPVRAQANIAGSSAGWGAGGSLPFIDFGELESGETARAVLQVRANTDVTITATSLNGGEMIALDHAGPGVPYTLSIDGVSGRLTSPLVLERRPSASLSGVDYPMIFQVGSVEGMFAGVYRDTVEVEVTGH